MHDMCLLLTEVVFHYWWMRLAVHNFCWLSVYSDLFAYMQRKPIHCDNFTQYAVLSSFAFGGSFAELFLQFQLKRP